MADNFKKNMTIIIILLFLMVLIISGMILMNIYNSNHPRDEKEESTISSIKTSSKTTSTTISSTKTSSKTTSIFTSSTTTESEVEEKKENVINFYSKDNEIIASKEEYNSLTKLGSYKCSSEVCLIDNINSMLEKSISSTHKTAIINDNGLILYNFETNKILKDDITQIYTQNEDYISGKSGEYSIIFSRKTGETKVMNSSSENLKLFTSLNSYNSNFYAVSNNGYWTLYDVFGKQILDKSYSGILAVYENAVLVELNRKMFLIDYNGNTISNVVDIPISENYNCNINPCSNIEVSNNIVTINEKKYNIDVQNKIIL